MYLNAHESRSAYRRSQQVIEGLLFAIILASPWAFGCTDPSWEFWLSCGVAAILLIFSVCLLTIGIPTWNAGRTGLAVLVGITGIALSAALHLLPMPESMTGLIAPGMKVWADPTAVLGELGAGLSTDLDTATLNLDTATDRITDRVAIYTGGSFQALVRLLLIGGFFGVVSCLQNPLQVLVRLSWAAVIVGTALAIFGLTQHFGSRDGLVYWTIPVEGGLGFGPFINRNHYPFFLNLALGLSIGLLIDRLESMGKYWPRMLFSDAAMGWLLVAIVFMISSLITCVSRGGLISAVIAIGVVSVLRMQVKKANQTLLIGTLVGVPVMLVLIWVGFSFHDSRLTMLTEADSYTDDGRWQLWKAAVQSVPQFPWLGSGGETYQHWETIFQDDDPTWNSWKSRSLRADNEFLDVLTEYGILGLASLLLLTGAVVRAALVACRRSAIAAGGTIGILAVALHSFVDFGLRVPATAVFAAAVGALVCCQASSRHTQRGDVRRKAALAGSGPRRLRVLTIASGIVLVAISLMAIRTHQRYRVADQARMAAIDDIEKNRAALALEKIVVGVQATPEDLQMRLDAIQVAQLAHDEIMQQESAKSSVIEGSRGSKLLTPADAQKPAEAQEIGQWIVSQSQIANRMCPIAWQPLAWLAQHGHFTATQRLELLQAARSLHPSEPDLAFLVGQMTAQIDGVDEAQDAWRDSLRYSTQHLREIGEQVTSTMMDRNLTADQMANQWIGDLLPADPVVTFAAATEIGLLSKVDADSELDSDSDPPISALEDRLLDRVMDLLNHPATATRQLDIAASEELRSRTLVALGQIDAAIDAMRLALNQQPENLKWRIQMAGLLADTNRLDEAVREVRIALTMDPNNAQAKKMQTRVSRLKAGGGATN